MRRNDLSRPTVYIVVLTVLSLTVSSICASAIGVQVHEANGATSRGPGVDLTIDDDDITLEPRDPIEGMNITIMARIGNLGPEDAYNVTLVIKVDEVSTQVLLNGTSDPVVLAGGADVEVVVEWTASRPSAGSHVVQVVLVNSTDQAELDFTDNSASTILTMQQGKAEVVIESVEPVSPVTFYIGDIVNITVELRNIGNADSPGLGLRFYRDGYKVSDVMTPLISGNGTSSIIVSHAWNTSGSTTGDHRYSVALDGGDLVNTANITLIDIDELVTVKTVLLSSSSVVQGEVVEVTVGLVSEDKVIARNVTILFVLDLDGGFVGWINGTVPPGGEVVNLTFQWDTGSVEPGTHFISARTGASTGFSSFIEVTMPVVDVRIEDIFHPLNVDEGSTFILNVGLRNDGTSPANGLEVRLFEDGVLMATKGFSIGASDEITIDLKFIISHVVGDTLVGLRIEVGDVYRSSMVLVKDLATPVPKVEIESFSILPTRLERGDDGTISLLLINRGSVTAHAYHIEFFYDDEPLLQDVINLPINKRETISFDWRVPASASYGKHEIRVEVWKELKGELVETQVETFTVPEKVRPYLEIIDLKISKLPPNAPVSYTITEGYFEGETLYITLNILNSGKLNATDVLVIMTDGEGVTKTKTISKIPSNEERNVVFVWKAKSGRHTLGFEIQGFLADRTQSVEVRELLSDLSLDMIGVTIFFITLLSMIFAIRRDIGSRERPSRRLKALEARVKLVKDGKIVSKRTKRLIRKAKVTIKGTTGREDGS